MMFGYTVKPNFIVDNEKAISTAPKVDFSAAPQPPPATARPSPAAGSPAPSY